MAVQQVGNRVYAKITDLTEESMLANGDKFIFHCASTGNASLIDWSNVKIDLDHCTFGTQFTQILNFTQTATAWVNEMTTSFEEVQAQASEAMDLVNQMSNDIAALKMLVKLIIGIAATHLDGKTNYSVDDFINSLSAEAKEIVKGIINDVDQQLTDTPVNFNTWNLYIACAAPKASEEKVD